MKKERKGKEKWMVSEYRIDIYLFYNFYDFINMFVTNGMEKKTKIVKTNLFAEEDEERKVEIKKRKELMRM